MGLGFVFTAQDLASGVIRRIDGQFGSLERRAGISGRVVAGGLSAMRVGAASVAVGVGLLGSAFAVANIAGEFDQAIAGVAAVAADGRENLDALREAAIQAGIATQYGPRQAAEALGNLAQAGFNSRRSIELLNPALNLAAASMGRLGVEGASSLLAQSMMAFPDAAADATMAVDQMANVANISALSIEQLPIALGRATAGASVMHQSFRTTLTSLGLVRNIMPGIERASTGLAVAMERMTNAETIAAIRARTHVEVVDQQTGQFRDFLDIIAEMGPALSDMTDEQRAQFLTSTFGAHAMGSLNAIMTQLTQGITTNSGAVLTGSEAVAYLRNEMEGATGAANRFASAMLDTFPGQLTLLRGSLETLAISFGEPFAQVIRPAVESVVGAVNSLIAAFRSLSPRTQRLIAGFTAFLGVLLVAFGAFAMLAGAVMMLAPAFAAIGIGFSGLLFKVVLPLIAAFAAISAVIYLFRRAYDENLGGIARTTNMIGTRLTAAWHALGELFSEGSMSAAVSEELKATGEGFRGFVIDVYQVGFRIQRFVEGIGAGFQAFWTTIGPTFGRLTSSLGRLMAAFGFVSSAASGLAETPSTSWAEEGIRIGEALGRAFEFVVEVITAVTDALGGMISGGMHAWKLFSEFTEPLGESIGMLFDAFMDLGVALGLTSASTSDSLNGPGGWVTFGRVLGSIVAAALAITIDTIRFLVDIVTTSIQGFTTWIRVIRAVGLSIRAWLVTPFLEAMNVIDQTIMAIGRATAMIPESFRPAGSQQLIDAGAAATSRVAARTGQISVLDAEASAARSDAARFRSGPFLASAEQAAGSDSTGAMAQLADQVGTLGRGLSTQPVVVRAELRVDGEKLAEHTATATRSSGHLGFAGNANGGGA